MLKLMLRMFVLNSFAIIIHVERNGFFARFGKFDFVAQGRKAIVKISEQQCSLQRNSRLLLKYTVFDNILYISNLELCYTHS